MCIYICVMFYLFNMEFIGSVRRLNRRGCYIYVPLKYLGFTARVIIDNGGGPHLPPFDNGVNDVR